MEQRFDLTYRSLPKSLPYDGGAPPEGYVLEHRTSKLLWIPGGATLLASWLYTAMAAGLVGKSHLAIPLAGPWIDLARGGDNREARRTDVLAGSLQALGAGMLVAGLLIDEPRFVRADLAGVRVSPMIGAEMMGARLGAQF